MVDMAHFAGLVAGGGHPAIPHAMSSPRPRTRRCAGPARGFILTDDEALAKKINSAVFPGTQGGPLMHTIAAKAVAFGEARGRRSSSTPERCGERQALAETLKSRPRTSSPAAPTPT